MIEREFIKTKIKNLKIKDKINTVVTKGAGCGSIVIEKTPLGEKIIVDTLRPGLVIGRGGETIKRLTTELKSKYKLENPQIEVRQILKPNLVAASVAKRIADEMERFGPQRFKSMGYRALGNIMREGAMGAEIVISGRGVPSQRSKTWRFYAGYLKKCGDIAINKVDKAIERVNHRSGAKGVVVKIMLPDTFIPDRITVQPADVKEVKVEELKEVPAELKEINSKEKLKEEVKKDTTEQNLTATSAKAESKSKQNLAVLPAKAESKSKQNLAVLPAKAESKPKAEIKKVVKNDTKKTKETKK
jgi:small subunit ribosomal protein S3